MPLLSIEQCLGPCVNEVDEEEYKKITKQITQFIQGRYQRNHR